MFSSGEVMRSWITGSKAGVEGAGLWDFAKLEGCGKDGVLRVMPFVVEVAERSWAVSSSSRWRARARAAATSSGKHSSSESGCSGSGSGWFFEA